MLVSCVFLVLAGWVERSETQHLVIDARTIQRDESKTQRTKFKEFSFGRHLNKTRHKKLLASNENSI